MHKLHISRTQWAVGNGFFHSGKISSDSSTFTYVYDCGALSHNPNKTALYREIDEFSKRSERIDVCFISHFDFDHVSGISYLARSTPVTQFVIPLLPAPQRLFAYARQLSQGLFDTSQNDEDMETYQRLITDPAATLGELTEADPERDDTPVVPVEPDGDYPANDGRDGDAEVNQISYTDPNILNPRGVGSADRGRLRLVRKRSSFAISGSSKVWEWKYAVTSQIYAGASEFIDSLINQKVLKSRAELNDISVVNDLVLNHAANLKQAYDDATAMVGSSFTRNLTSLMLYSGPPLASKYYAYRSRSNVVERAEIGAWNPRPGWLALGDADIRSKARLNDVNATWASYKPHVSTFAPSHHGSKKDWHIDLARGFSAGGDYSPTFVFSASGDWGHPHHEVLLEINDLGGTAVITSLDERSRWTESITAYVDK